MTMQIELKFKPTNAGERQAAEAALKAVEASLKESLTTAGQSPTLVFPVHEVKTTAQTRQVRPYESDSWMNNCVELITQFAIHVDDAGGAVNAGPKGTPVRPDFRSEADTKS